MIMNSIVLLSIFYQEEIRGVGTPGVPGAFLLKEGRRQGACPRAPWHGILSNTIIICPLQKKKGGALVATCNYNPCIHNLPTRRTEC